MKGKIGIIPVLERNKSREPRFRLSADRHYEDDEVDLPLVTSSALYQSRLRLIDLANYRNMSRAWVCIHGMGDAKKERVKTWVFERLSVVTGYYPSNLSSVSIVWVKSASRWYLRSRLIVCVLLYSSSSLMMVELVCCFRVLMNSVTRSSREINNNL